MTAPSFWDRVLRLAAALDRCSYYDVLGLPRDAAPDAVKAAFWRLAPRLHPDRHTRERSAQRQRALTLVYARLREAYDVLSDPRTREEYDRGLAAGKLRHSFEPATRTRAAKVTRPAEAKARRFYEMGIERLQAGDHQGARMQLEIARQLMPGSDAIERALARLDELSKQRGREPQPQPQPEPQPHAHAQPQPEAPASPLTQRFTQLVSRSPIASAVGIDFGTSYSSIAAGVGDHVYLVPDAYGRTLHPSVVSFQDNGLAAAGWNAREDLVTRPRTTVSSPKRLLGRNHDDPVIAGMLHGVAYQTEAGPDGQVMVEIGLRQYMIAQVCAEVVAHIRDIAERQLETKITQAVLSLPITFSEEQRSALERVARLAGIEVLGFLEEPAAAAMAYGFGQGKSEVVAVYDFGGGTFDFTILDISNYSFEVLARAGDSWLGGDDFDNAIASAIANAVWRKTNVELRDRAVEWQRLLFACEHTKRQLSRLEAAPVIVERLLEHPRPVNLRQMLPRATMEQLCRDLMLRSLEICRRTMGSIALEPEDLDQVVVSGGVSRIPFVRAALARFFKRDIPSLVNPDEAIALGAGLRAAQLSRFPVLGAGAL